MIQRLILVRRLGNTRIIQQMVTVDGARLT